jgi:hypothetical protein
MISVPSSRIEREKLYEYKCMKQLDLQNLFMTGTRDGTDASEPAIIDDNVADFIKLLYLMYVETDKNKTN